ncbi:hypothetical protein [Cryptosporangium sp. NPDC051539]|uniref:hypothetical protein n=1 Tax=Cryptosporangium sp. NPDC051539 TaxID=3363962 RepID=UPI0037AB5D67
MAPSRDRAGLLEHRQRLVAGLTGRVLEVGEIRRVLRPGGQLRFLEHVAADQPGALRWSQKIADATVWPLLLGGCRTGRDTLAAITATGFTVEECDRFRVPAEGPAGPSAPTLRGRALR